MLRRQVCSTRVITTKYTLDASKMYNDIVIKISHGKLIQFFKKLTSMYAIMRMRIRADVIALNKAAKAVSWSAPFCK